MATNIDALKKSIEHVMQTIRSQMDNETLWNEIWSVIQQIYSLRMILLIEYLELIRCFGMIQRFIDPLLDDLLLSMENKAEDIRDFISLAYSFKNFVKILENIEFLNLYSIRSTIMINYKIFSLMEFFIRNMKLTSIINY